MKEGLKGLNKRYTSSYVFGTCWIHTNIVDLTIISVLCSSLLCYLHMFEIKKSIHSFKFNSKMWWVMVWNVFNSTHFTCGTVLPHACEQHVQSCLQLTCKLIYPLSRPMNTFTQLISFHLLCLESFLIWIQHFWCLYWLLSLAYTGASSKNVISWESFLFPLNWYKQWTWSIHTKCQIVKFLLYFFYIQLMKKIQCLRVEIYSI